MYKTSEANFHSAKRFARLPHHRLSQLAALMLTCTPLLAAHAQMAENLGGVDNLPALNVQASSLLDPQLHLKQRAQSGSHVNVSTQDLPASLSAVSAETVRERADNEMADAVTRTVGLSSTASPGNGGLSFASRGFSGVNSVGVAEDGLSLAVAGGTVNYPADTWGYERFEVLRGPASLMFGSGTMGATVNAIRKVPSANRETDLLLGGGSHGSARLGFGTTGAIQPDWTYRVDAYGTRSSGERQLGKSSSTKLMSALRWQASRDLSFELNADISEQQPERYFGTPTVNGQLAHELRDFNYNVADSDIHYDDRRIKLKTEWLLAPKLVLKNSTYHFSADRHWKNIEAYGYNPSAQTISRADYLEIGHDVTQTGNQMNLQADLGVHQLAFGWAVSRAKFKALNSSPYTGSSTVSAFDPEHGLWDSPDPYTQKQSNAIRQQALYLEDAWSINDKWVLMGGIRRDWYHFDRKDVVSQAKLNKSLNGTSWRVGLTHRLTPSTSVYGQVSSGHDPVTSLLSLSSSQSGFTLSEGRQLELGIKQQLPEARGEWTLAVFDIDKKDIITRDPMRPTVSVQGGKQSSRGVEVSGSWQPNRMWRFDGNVGWVDAQFDSLLEGSTGADRAGNRPANTPKLTANLWAHLSVDAWRLSLGARHVGQRYSNNANTSALPSFTVVDAVASWRVNPKLSLNLVGRNLGNRTYAQSSYAGQWLLGAVRSFELNAQFQF